MESSTKSHNKYLDKTSKHHQIQCLYDLEETIGQGHFAVVKLARHIFTGEKVAIKVIDKTRLDTISREHLFQEVRCMKLVQHPNVVRLYEVIDTDKKLYLILELGDGGDMYDYIMKHTNGLSESKARDYFIQIVRAIKYCHDLHVVHRDLKPENVVFFESTGEVKLTDFGFSNVFVPGKKLNTSCGSLAYSAPEILLGDSYDAPAVDVWSLGVILFMLVTGRAPFQEANDSETLTMILDCKYYLPPHLSFECQDLIAHMLVREPEKRIKLDNLIKHEWLQLNDQIDSNCTNTNYMIPLIKRKSLSEIENNQIIESMVKGNIASKNEIKLALDEDEYNYITATYYLLSERLLRSKNQTNLNRINNNKSLKQSLKQNNSHVPTNDLNEVKRKKSNGLSIQIERIIDEDQEIPKSPIESSTSNCTSPCKLKHKNGLSEQIIQENEFEFDINQSDNSQLLTINNNRRLQIQTSTIPEEECEEIENISLDNHINNTKNNNSNNINNKTSNHMQNSQHLLNQIYEEGEEESADGESTLKTVITINQQQLQNNKKSVISTVNGIRSSISEGGETSTDISDGELNILTINLPLKKNKKTRNQKKTSLISSISDVSGGEETTNLIKGPYSIRTRSAESSNDLILLNPPLRSLSNDHRFTNQSQMSISSQLSKSNSVRHRDRDTPVHLHSSTPTPRESVVFKRGDEKPIAKILQSQTRTSSIIPSSSYETNNKTNDVNNGSRRVSSSSSTSSSTTTSNKSSLSDCESTLKASINLKINPSQFNSSVKRNKHNDSYSRAMSSSLLRKNSDFQNHQSGKIDSSSTKILNSPNLSLINGLNKNNNNVNNNNTNNNNNNKSCINCCSIL